MEYESIPEITKLEVEESIKRNDPEELLYTVLSVALYSEDLNWAESICLKLAKHPHFNVRGNAILGFGHLARIHGKLTEKNIKPIIEAALQDEDEYVRGQAWSASDDVEHFLKWKVKKPLIDN